ncbi:MAG: DUF31 family protein [Mycoplasmataceae bacterium]|nr:DUF31 family protein [Mycoplasmataceae bacterium]
MTKKMKYWTLGIFGGIIAIGAGTFLISLYACKPHYTPGYYANTDDLYMLSGYDTVSVNCINTKKTSNVLIQVEDGDIRNYITIIGWENTSYKIRYSTTISTLTSFDITIGTTDNSFAQYTKSVFLHPSTDNDSLNVNNTNISTVSMDLFGKKGNKGASGTGWVLKHVTSSDIYYKDDGNNYQYYLMTNWHVEQMYSSINANSYSWGANGVSHSFLDFHKVSGATIAGHNNIGSDTYLYYAEFNFANNPTKFSAINTLCDSNEDYSFKLASYTSDEIKTEQFFIGGYPITNRSKRTFEYKFVTCRGNDFFGYAGQDYINNPIELVTMSHFLEVKSTWAIGNDIIMNPTVCNSLSGGASGSIVLDTNGDLVGIYWGGRTLEGSNAFCGNIETLCKIAPLAGSNFLDYSLSDESTLNWYNQHNINVPLAA